MKRRRPRKGNTQSEHHDTAEDARKDQADQVEAIILLAQAVPAEFASEVRRPGGSARKH